MKNNSKNHKLIKQMVIDAMFLALIALFTLVPNIGYIPLGPVSIQFISVFVLIGAACFGWKRGLLYGFFFGLSSLLKVLTIPAGWFDALFLYPWNSILPRMIFGLVSGLVFDLVRKNTTKDQFIISCIPLGILLTLFHSFIVLTLIYFFNLDAIFVNMGLGDTSVGAGYVIIVLASFVGIQIILEAVVGGMLTPIIVGIIFRNNLVEFNGKNVKQTAKEKDINTFRNMFSEELNRRSKIMKIDYAKLVKPYEEEMLKTLKELVAIGSVYDETTVSDETPYGINPKKALEFMKNLAISKGFKAEIVGNRCVEITYGTKGTEVGVFGHLDVVPLGENWKHDPLGCEIENGIMYGRGVADDKGPVVASFYACCALKDQGLLDDFRLRFVCGSDEERGSSCLEYYFNVAKKPAVDTGITPDADYPLIHAEKGISNYTLKGNINLGNDIVSISAGTAANVVIDKAIIEVKDVEGFNNYLSHQEVKYSVEGNKVIFYGKSAHGSTPELGDNAGVKLLKYAGEYFNSEVLKILALQYSDYNGRKLNHFVEKPILGKTTYNLGVISYENNHLELVVNFRFPEETDGVKILNEIQEISPLPLYFEEPSKVLYYDPNCKLVTTLMNVYQEETGDYTSKPLAIGGGTYAKEAANIVAFGPTFVGRNYKIHEADEEIPVQDLLDNLRIYAHAIYDLGTK